MNPKGRPPVCCKRNMLYNSQLNMWICPICAKTRKGKDAPCINSIGA